MPDVILSLGGVDFQDFEIPESIGFGGDQALAVHKLIGGIKLVDSMGRDDADLTWAARFRGADAVSRARQIDALRIGGQQQALTWADFSYVVVIKSFKASYERAGIELPYTITLEVVQDNSTPATADDGDDADSAIDSDMDDASDLGGGIGDATLSGQLAAVQSGLTTLVGSVVQAAPSHLLGIANSVRTAQGRVTTLAAGLNDQVDDSSDFGGVTAGGDPEDIIASFTGTAAAVGAMPAVYAAGSLLGRVSTNLGAVGVSGRQVTQAGGTLYDLSTKAYGDPSGWTTIAEANQITDPVLSGVNTIFIPPAIDGTDGVLEV